MEISEAQKVVDKWINSYGVRYFNELTNMAVLMEEVGELSRVMARCFGEQSFKKETSDAEAKEMIKEEIADVFFVLLCLSNQMDIDINDAFLKSLEKKSRRDKNRHHQNKKLDVK